MLALQAYKHINISPNLRHLLKNGRRKITKIVISGVQCGDIWCATEIAPEKGTKNKNSLDMVQSKSYMI